MGGSDVRRLRGRKGDVAVLELISLLLVISMLVCWTACWVGLTLWAVL